MTPGRVLKISVALDIIERESERATYEDLKDMISGQSNCRSIYDGKFEEGIAWGGQVMGLINDIPTVQELIDKMIHSVEKGLSRIENFIGERIHR